MLYLNNLQWVPVLLGFCTSGFLGYNRPFRLFLQPSTRIVIYAARAREGVEKARNFILQLESMVPSPFLPSKQGGSCQNWRNIVLGASKSTPGRILFPRLAGRRKGGHRWNYLILIYDWPLTLSTLALSPTFTTYKHISPDPFWFRYIFSPTRPLSLCISLLQFLSNRSIVVSNIYKLDQLLSSSRHYTDTALIYLLIYLSVYLSIYQFFYLPIYLLTHFTMGVHIKHCLLIPLINYNTDTGLDVVFDLFPGQEPTITLCVCARPRQENGVHRWMYRLRLLWTQVLKINRRPVSVL